MSNSEAVCNHVKKRKRDLVSVLGGKCCICGFDGFQEGFDFHHVNPQEKSFGFGAQAATKALIPQLEELKKCVLVCSNCHRGIHASIFVVPENWQEFYDYQKAEELIKENQLIKEGKKYYCQRCGRLISYKASHCEECSKLISRKVDRPQREELKQLIRTLPFTTIAKKYGVSDNAIRRWCDGYGLPRKKTEIQKISNEDWEQI